MHRKPGTWLFLAAGLIATLTILAWGMLRSPQNAFDDAFITYRYAANLQKGLGLVYNPGEWVLGTTAPLYALLLGVLRSFAGPVEWWGHWVSVAAWIVSAWAALGQLWQRQRYAAGMLSALLIAVVPWIIPALGMETAFLVALLLLASWAWMSDRRLLAPALSAVAVLTRQDALLFIGLLFVARCLSRRRILWRQGLLAAGLVLPWFAYAFLRYGSILPNSALAKINQNQFMAAGGGKGFVEQFLLYLHTGSALAAVAIAISLAAGLYVIVRYAREWWWLPCWVVMYLAIYTVLNVASFPWYFIPPLIGAVLVCAIGAGWLLGDGRMATRPSGIAAVIRPALALACVLVIGYTYVKGSLAASVKDNPGYLAEYRDVGAWLAGNTRKTDQVAAIEIGVIGYLSQRPILDTMGLVSPEMRGHLLGWGETVTYATWQHSPDYAVAVAGTAWDMLTSQWWFQERYRPVAQFGRATVYERQSQAAAMRYAVEEATEFESGFAITGMEAPEQKLSPGETLHILLHVAVARNPGSDCQVITYLADAATYERVSLGQERPYGGGYSCAAWQPGDSLRIPLQVAVPRDIAPGTYRIGFEFIETERGSFLPLRSSPAAHDVLLGWLRVGDPERQTAGAPWTQLAARWQNGLTLSRVALADRPLAPGQTLLVGFEWQTGRAQDRDLTFFVHLVDKTGNLVAQSDKRPFGGRFPTTVWLPGETLQDAYALQIPDGLAAGVYTLRAGFYDGTGRVPLAGGTADHLVLDRTLQVAER